jgi:DNA segregation ATPase FtsK/SpoIIIE, S-DNA-T family
MSTIQVTREARRPAPSTDKGEFPLQEPPGLPDSTGSNLSSMLMYLPMMVGSGAMMMFFVQPGQNPIMMYMSAGIMGVALLVMAGAMVMRSSTERKNKLKHERRDYLRYLGQARKQIRRSIDKQRTAAFFTHPDPARLWALVPTDRLWERRSNHADFAEVRIGVGQQRLTLQMKAPQTKPVADLEPLCASALRRFLRAYSLVEDTPVAVYLRGFARMSLEGDLPVTRALARAIVAQASTFHSCEDLRIAVFAGGDRLRHWDWVKWLPHNQHPEEADAAGPARLVSDEWGELERLLGGKDLDERGRFEPGAIPTSSEPFVIVVLDGPAIPGNHRLAGAGYRNLIAIDVDASLPWDGAASTLRLRLTPDRMEKVTLNRVGDEEKVAIGRPDSLSLVRARALARQAAPYRLNITAVSTDSATISTDLASLLGIPDLRAMDPTALWHARTVWDHLRIPIGMGGNGQPLELDLKESAQGGMGPHGILIGATGSGKSELIRTLVLSLAMTHSSEKLNMVLVDFKGGATFLGLDGLPHVSALITNLADELPLVDRMQDALQGELVRRQELLRKYSYTSLHEYERARAGGAQLDPLATLVVIVDEFGELLATKNEFIDLFMMIGRLGRSLGVHLLLASQRFDEGRVHTLETHLSYRIGLRMFSSMESRSVIGTVDAYEQPLQPGMGYLRTDTTTLVRFRGAYTSGACPVQGRRRTAGPVSDSRIVPFEAGHVIPMRRPEPPSTPVVDATEEEAVETVLQVIVDKLRDAGPPAHRVWLPPLDKPTTLDRLLPPLGVDEQRGFGTRPPSDLKVPVALIDRPFEQRRELMLADLEGGKGHVAVVGGPRSGKSNLIRTLIASLALTHTPRQVQFYILDFGGGSMVTLGDLPHVGGVAQRRDSDRVIRTVAEMTALLNLRETYFAQQGVDSMATYRRARAAGRFADDPFGDVFLVIDGWFTMRQEYEAQESQLQEIASRGLSYGIHLVVGAGRWSEIRPWLRDVLQTRFELRLGDPMESEIDFRKAKDVPEVAGRGLTLDKYHYLSALPRIDGQPTAEDVSDGLAALVASVREHWSGPTAPQVRLLPERLHVRELPGVPPEGELRVPYGLDERLLQPVWHDFETTPHLFAFGDTETGKTNLIRLMAEAITSRFTPQEAQVVMCDPRRKLQDAIPANQLVGYAMHASALTELVVRGAPELRKRVPGPDIGPERLSKRDWWTGPRLFVLVDDYDMVASSMDCPLAAFVDLLAQGSEIGLHLIITRNTSSASRGMYDPAIRRMWDLGTPGLLFSCPRDEGQFMGEAKPRKLPTGRAQLVHRRQGVTLVQTALAAEAADGS